MERGLALMIAYPLFCALNHLHRKQIVHEDVKPANLLFDVEDGEAILCDFRTSRKILATDECIGYIATRDYRGSRARAFVRLHARRPRDGHLGSGLRLGRDAAGATAVPCRMSWGVTDCESVRVSEGLPE